MPKKKTLVEFIQDAIKVHGDKYDYSKVEYNGNKNKVVIICKEHGEFKQTPNSHLKNGGCKKCGHKKTEKLLSNFSAKSSGKAIGGNCSSCSGGTCSSC